MLYGVFIIGVLAPFAHSQRTPTLGLANGYLSLDIGSAAAVRLVKDSQVLASFKPSAATNFDYAPFDRLSQRQYDGYVSTSSRTPQPLRFLNMVVKQLPDRGHRASHPAGECLGLVVGRLCGST